MACNEASDASAWQHACSGSRVAVIRTHVDEASDSSGMKMVADVLAMIRYCGALSAKLWVR